MATYSTTTAIGIKQDLSDMIYDISPEETPFTSLIKKGTARDTSYNWQIDSLAAANANNAAAEGADAGDSTLEPTTIVSGRTQIFTKDVAVSGTLDAVDKAGRKKETAYQLAKKMKEIKLDIEARISSNLASDLTSLTRKTGGLGAWIKTNASLGAGGSAAGYASGDVAAPTVGTARPLTEALFEENIQSTWAAGGNPTTTITTAVLKGVITGFSGNATQTYHANNDREIINAVDVYRSDFGVLKIVPSRLSAAGTVFNIDPEMVSLDTLKGRGLTKTQMAKTGDSTKYQLVTEVGLSVKNEAAHGAIYSLTA